MDHEDLLVRNAFLDSSHFTRRSSSCHHATPCHQRPWSVQLANYRMNSGEIMAALTESRDTAWMEARKDPVVGVIADAVHESLTDWRKKTAAANATPCLPHSARPEMVDRLDQAGFAVVAESASRVRALAAISLMASFPLPRRTMADCFNTNRGAHDCDEDFDDVVAAIQHRGKELLNDQVLHGIDELRSVV